MKKITLILLLGFMSVGCAPEAVKQSVDMIRQANVKIAEEATRAVTPGEDLTGRLVSISGIAEDIEMLAGPVQDYIVEPDEFIAYTPDAAEALSKTTEKVVAFRLAVRGWWDSLKDKSKLLTGIGAKAATGWGYIEWLWTALTGAGVIGGGAVLKNKRDKAKAAAAEGTVNV